MMLSKRLKQQRKDRRLTQRELAARLGVTQQAIAKWEAGQAMPEPGTIARIATIFGVTADYFLGMSDSLTMPGRAASVRVIGTVRAGYNALALEEDMGSMPAEVNDAEEYRYLVVKGDSMAPYIRPGDLALVHIQPALKNGDLGVVIYGEGEATLKKYHSMNGTVTLTPFNDEYESITLSGRELEQLVIFGRVVRTSTNW